MSSCFYKSSLRLLSWSEILKATSQEDVILLLCAVELVSLAPVVGHGVGEDLSVLVKCALGDGLLAGLAGLQLGPRVLVPEGVLAVTAHCCQGAVHGVKCDVVHSKNVRFDVSNKAKKSFRTFSGLLIIKLCARYGLK